MALRIRTNSDGGEYQEVPKGTYAARLVDVLDEGFREDKFSKTGPGGKQQQYRYTYLLSEPMADGRPFSISEWVTISRMSAAGDVSRGALFKSDGKMSNFVARVEALTGMDLEAVGVERFDDELDLAESLIGKGCMVQVAVKPNGKSKVAGVMALPRGMVAPTGDFKRKRDRDGTPQAAQPVYVPGRNTTTLPGEPPWWLEALTVGKHKGKTWADMAAGSMGGARHQWCEYVVAFEATGDAQREVQRRAAVVLKMYEDRNAELALPDDQGQVPF